MINLRATEKLWGVQFELSHTPIHWSFLCFAKAGGFTSIHRHNCDHSIFVASGEIIVDLQDGWAQRLRANQSRVILAREKHQFLAVQDSWLVEVYLNFDGSEQSVPIERFSVGGMAEDGDAIRAKYPQFYLCKGE